MKPSRGEIWQVELDPVRAHEQAGVRPALIMSIDGFNHGPAGLIVAIPLTTKRKGIPWHVAVSRGEAGLQYDSFIKCEDVRSISTDRLLRRWGIISDAALRQVEDRLRILLGL
jgi:mRNA interferase MazF